MGRASGSFNSRYEQVVQDIVTSSASDGVVCTGDAAANTKGTWVTNAAYKPTFSWNLLKIMAYNRSAADHVFDIGVDDGSGNVYVICPDLRCPGLRTARMGMVQYLLPLHVPKDKQIAFRCAGSTGSLAIALTIGGHSNGIGGAQGFSRMVSLYTPASSRGVAVDPGATAHTKGAWAQLTSSSSDRIVGLMFAVGHNGDIGRAANARGVIDIGIGAAASERVLIADSLVIAETAIDSWYPIIHGPFPCDVPAGTRFAARFQNEINTASDRLCDIAAWGFVP